MAMSPNTYTVKKGDTLSGIASKYRDAYNKSNGTNLTTYKYVDKLVDINDLDNANLILVGQVLKLEGTKPTTKKNTSNKATIKLFGLQSNSDNTLFATWKWDRDHVDNYKVKWEYATGDGVWFIGSDGTSEYKQSTYSIPANATKVRFRVKPISTKKKTKTKSGKEKETAYWTADWSTEKIHKVQNPPATPSIPSVSIENYKLTMSVDGTDVTGTGSYIEFQIVKNDIKTVKTQKVDIRTNHASYEYKVDAGAEYKVRCRAIKGDLESEWSAYSSNVDSGPSASKGIKKIKALSKSSVSVTWHEVSKADSYDVQYTTDKRYFDTSNEERSITVKGTTANVTGLTIGQEYFFRVRAVKGDQTSAWTDIESIILGDKPAAPTTWSSTSTAIVGEPLNLYWMHNSSDGSKWTKAELELIIDKQITTINNFKNNTAEDEADAAIVYSFDTSIYTEGTKIEWRARTAGITGEWSDWSILRTVDTYAQPSVEVYLPETELTSFPLMIHAMIGQQTNQKPIGYHISVLANESYESVDDLGNPTIVNTGSAVYEKYFDIADVALSLYLSAGDINLENNINYTVVCTASMDSGLIAEDSSGFKVAWTDVEYSPNAEISIDPDSLTASILPYCEDEEGAIIQNIRMSVYRREYDGSFTELATDLVPGTTITDPHPALDYARYRIVAVTTSTGAVSYYDMPGVVVGETSVIIQWDEDWSEFNVSSDDPMEQPPWSGSLLKLPYNIDVSEKPTKDVELVEYIGRRHPVSYYGTQIGESTSWSVAIEKDDEETIYALRRLAIYVGDVYVREPSGVGYWATINVSFSQTHNELTIPVTLDITRVEGGA